MKVPFVNSSEEPRKPLKVLFMHGLESGPRGSKDRYLRRYFEVCTPDMKTSLFGLTRANSVIRNVLRRPLFLGWAAAAATTLPCAIAMYGPLAGPAWAVVFGAVLATIRKPLERSVQQHLGGHRPGNVDRPRGSGYDGATGPQPRACRGNGHPTERYPWRRPPSEFRSDRQPQRRRVERSAETVGDSGCSATMINVDVRCPSESMGCSDEGLCLPGNVLRGH